MEYSIKKNTSILPEIISGNIKKEKSKAKKLNKSDKWGLGILTDPTSTI